MMESQSKIEKYLLIRQISLKMKAVIDLKTIFKIIILNKILKVRAKIMM